MEAQVEFVSPYDVTQLRDRIKILEAGILRERRVRLEVEAERDEARSELATLKAAAQPAEPACQEAVSTPEQEGPAQTEPASAGTQLAVSTHSQQNVEEEAVSDHADGSDKRRDLRVASQLSATYWCAGMTEAANCIICDKSSGGARLECAPSRYRIRTKELVVGDQITLSFENALEHTSVVCVVMWAAGTRCGVRFFGQFHNTMKGPRTTPRMKPAPKAESGGMLGWRRSGAR